MQRVRMSRKALKQVMRQTEVSPEIKRRIRSLRVARARQRMMAELPTATVVITNPQHVAVALRYAPPDTPAPIVIAKGLDHLALRMRTLAATHAIPIVENPPLARALHKALALHQDIPAAYYQAVAEIIRYVYTLQGKTLGT